MCRCGAFKLLSRKNQLKAEKVGRDYLIREADLDRIKAGVNGRPKGSRNKPKKEGNK